MENGDQILCFPLNYTPAYLFEWNKIGLNDSSQPSLMKGLSWDVREVPPPVKKRPALSFLLSFVEIKQTCNFFVIWFPLVSAFAIPETFNSFFPVLRLLEYIGWFSIDCSDNFVLGWCNSIRFDFWGEFIDLHGNTVACHFPTLSAL